MLLQQMLQQLLNRGSKEILTWDLCCCQARQQGTLDSQVTSLQARKALLKSLHLIPPGFTFEDASAALDASPENSRLPLLPTLPIRLFDSMPFPPSHKQQGASKRSNNRAANTSRPSTTSRTETTVPASGHRAVQQARKPWPAYTGRLSVR
jgi:hypothetical protein